MILLNEDFPSNAPKIMNNFQKLYSEFFDLNSIFIFLENWELIYKILANRRS